MSQPESKPEKFRKTVGYATIVTGIILLLPTVFLQLAIETKSPSVALALSMFQDFTVGLLSFGFVLVGVDPFLYRFQKDYDDKETEKASKQKLISRLKNRVPYTAAQASEELQAYKWVADGSLEKLNFVRAYLSRAMLMGAKMRESNFEGADLSDSDLRGVDFEGANFEGAKLVGADLTGANLKGANFDMADLTGAFLDGANMSGAYLGEANLKDASIYGAKTSWGVRFDEGNHIEWHPTIFDAETCLPDETLWTPETDMRRFTDAKYDNQQTQ